MAHFRGATFAVSTGGETCPMYNDPDANDREDLFEQHRYIEAITGATFKVKVTLDSGFEFGSCDAIRFLFSFDNTYRDYYQDITRQDFLARKYCYASIDSVCRYCDKSGEWQRGSLSFGKLEIKEKGGSDVSPEELKDLGSIRLSYQRIRYGATREKDTPSRRNHTERIAEVSEKTLKGASIANSVEAVNFRKSKPPSTSYREAFPLPGILGYIVTMNVSYRSKRTLQMLECIPRSPSPALVSRPTGISDPANNETVQEELHALRTRLAKLEGRPDDSPQANIKTDVFHSHLSIKRERGEKENQPSRKRSRQSGPIEIVDLTDD